MIFFSPCVACYLMFIQFCFKCCRSTLSKVGIKKVVIVFYSSRRRIKFLWKERFLFVEPTAAVHSKGSRINRTSKISNLFVDFFFVLIIWQLRFRLKTPFIWIQLFLLDTYLFFKFVTFLLTFEWFWFSYRSSFTLKS